MKSLIPTLCHQCSELFNYGGQLFSNRPITRRAITFVPWELCALTFAKETHQEVCGFLARRTLRS